MNEARLVRLYIVYQVISSSQLPTKLTTTYYNVQEYIIIKPRGGATQVPHFMLTLWCALFGLITL